jgi:SpoIIAA-like
VAAARRVRDAAGMIEQFSDMPPGTLGFLLTGEVTREEYRDVLLPPLRDAVERGDGIRLLLQMGPSFDEFDPGAVLEDMKQAWILGVRHRDAWQRTAIVSDADWVTRTARVFAWMVPGDVRIYPLGEAHLARAWVAGQ